jgi:hypothetical protein
MKNLHLISTDKPSRLHLGNSGLVLCEFVLSKYTINGQHIYITNDEPIKEGDYGLSKLNEIIKFHSGYDYRYYAKIILTTDPDLIADGVQAIDDEFLEWFVKNPNCEKVEVTSDIRAFDNENREVDFAILKEDYIKIIYTIIIPQEESKQETLEEAAEFWDAKQTILEFEKSSNRPFKKAFEQGAKWQQEQDKNKYSDEDMLNLLEFIKDNAIETINGWQINRIGYTNKEILKQFKKNKL